MRCRPGYRNFFIKHMLSAGAFYKNSSTNRHMEINCCFVCWWWFRFDLGFFCLETVFIMVLNSKFSLDWNFPGKIRWNWMAMLHSSLVKQWWRVRRHWTFPKVVPETSCRKKDHLWPCLPSEEKKMFHSLRNTESIKEKFQRSRKIAQGLHYTKPLF